MDEQRQKIELKKLKWLMNGNPELNHKKLNNIRTENNERMVRRKF